MFHYFIENPELKDKIQFDKIQEKDLERLDEIQLEDNQIKKMQIDENGQLIMSNKPQQ